MSFEVESLEITDYCPITKDKCSHDCAFSVSHILEVEANGDVKMMERECLVRLFLMNGLPDIR